MGPDSIRKWKKGVSSAQEIEDELLYGWMNAWPRLVDK